MPWSDVTFQCQHLQLQINVVDQGCPSLIPSECNHDTNLTHAGKPEIVHSLWLDMRSISMARDGPLIWGFGIWGMNSLCAIPGSSIVCSSSCCSPMQCNLDFLELPVMLCYPKHIFQFLNSNIHKVTMILYCCRICRYLFFIVQLSSYVWNPSSKSDSSLLQGKINNSSEWSNYSGSFPTGNTWHLVWTFLFHDAIWAWHLNEDSISGQWCIWKQVPVKYVRFIRLLIFTNIIR